MANWIVQNCLDPSDTKIVNDNGPSPLQVGSVVAVITGQTMGANGCYTATEETLINSNANLYGSSTDCMDCLLSNLILVFRNCDTNLVVRVSPESFSGVGTPTVGTIYKLNVGNVSDECFELIGTESNFGRSIQATLINQYQTCLECQGGFSVSFDREILINNSYGLNKGGTLSISGDYTQPFTYFISDDNKVENVRIEGSSLIIGNSIGTLGIMLVDSNNFSATTTTEVLKRVSFNTNKGEIVNDVSYQNFKQNVKDNYNLLIQNRINPQSQENAK
jgi:hypothetical protein